MARFFIDRPVFAWVIAITMMLAGALAIITLPVAQYPNIAAPQISIAVTYPGASARTVQDTVVQVIEQRMNGIDGLQYMASSSSSDGSVELTLTFQQGTNADVAQVQVQNKLQLATPLLPQEVQQQGIRVTKATRNFLLIVGFVSKDGSLKNYDIANFLASTVQDPISRTAGVGDFQLFGSQYAMRIWLDPSRLNNYSLTALDVLTAIRAQNVQVSSGQLGGAPSTPGQQLNATIIGSTRLQTAEQFDAIVLRVNPDGSQVRLRDVARSELGAESYSFDTRYTGNPAAGLAIKLATGANALDTVKNVQKTIEDLRPFFPPGIEVIYPIDQTPFIKLSIEEVLKTLAEAIVLVFLVMYLFLQNFRATLIPTIAVPVVLLGTFAVLSAFGYSINTLTMFAVVLAIGLLVDDAIVVVENVERVMSEEGLSPREATRKSMGQIQGALVGIAMVLSAVFVPMAFFGGSTGVIYRQFSITIISAMVLSVAVAMILTPALCATMLKPVQKGHHHAKRGFFGWFNRSFDRGNRGYQASVGYIMRRTVRFFLVYALLVAGVVVLYGRVPSSFLPAEDIGQMFVQVQTPPGATMERTQAVVDEVVNYLNNDEKAVVEGTFSVVGFSFAGRGQNGAIIFARLRDWSLRPTPDLRVQALAQRTMARMSQVKDAIIFAIAPPPVPELGNATGFDFQLQDRAGLGYEQMLAARNQLLGAARQRPELVGVRPNGIEDAPQFQLVIDRERVAALGLSIADVNNTMSAVWGSAYVNDFIDRGRVKRVYLQGDAPARMMPDDLNKWYVRNANGQMVPFSAFGSAQWTSGPQKLERYNGVPSFNIQGNAAPGRSSGEAMAVMEELARQLPAGIGFEWTNLSFEEKASGAQAPALFAISLIVVFLSLAALYESWSVPFAVMLGVPLGILGAVGAAVLFKLSNDVYFQVGLLTTIGLSAKNAILIVEFAKEAYDRGVPAAEAALQAAGQRLRPILMTSLAFILGVTPLAISNGAGSGAQNAIGIGVIGGMLTATFIAIFLVPMFFVAMMKLFRVKPAIHRNPPEKAPELAFSGD
ncbi:multidrug efflux pump [Stella humosa]|uniref:Efflux pump membrane transporter n=1 Tax=Stella humosa TaxID=94 RepID=A0A3N1KJ35_9PROT|nr:efflux RND transporter permease subunit [Stella humosa]ROP80841.1 multidrug efflux pump [Stella humosa]BBK33367.1 multidrug efflux RND transporter permease subunit [Stella humosa]